jgi:hypothetical protein
VVAAVDGRSRYCVIGKVVERATAKCVGHHGGCTATAQSMLTW